MTGAPRIEVQPDPAAVAKLGAEVVAEHARAAVAQRTLFTLAVSGGSTPWAMFAELSNQDFPWSQTEIYQVDERIAPAGDPSRNLTHLCESLPPSARTQVYPMPVENSDLQAATYRYARTLPQRFDLIHLGLGPDGHTASLIPGDPVLEVTDRDVALTRPYMGHRRMTLTYPVLNRTRAILWLVTGADKLEALSRLRASDPSIPAGLVVSDHALIVADRAAAGG